MQPSVRAAQRHGTALGSLAIDAVVSVEAKRKGALLNDLLVVHLFPVRGRGIVHAHDAVGKLMDSLINCFQSARKEVNV